MLVADVVKVVVVRVLRHAAVEVCPCQNIHCILLVLDGLDRDLREEVVVKHVGREVRLDRETFGEEFLVEVLAGLLTHENTAATVILRWAACATHHLKHVHHRIVDVAVLLALVGLHAHDNDHIASNRETPCSILRCDEDLNSARLEQPFDDMLILLVESFVIVANAMLERLGQALVTDMVEVRLEGFLLALP